MGEAHPRRRLFVALELPEVVKASVRSALAPLADLPARWTRPEGLHLTLAFLGDTSASRLPELTARLEEVARRHRELHLELAGSGTFGGTRPRVLWLGLSGDTGPAIALADDVGQAVGLEPTPWTAHVTVARSHLRRGDGALEQARAALATFRSPPFVASGVTLFESRAGRYLAHQVASLESSETARNRGTDTPRVR